MKPSIAILAQAITTTLLTDRLTLVSIATMSRHSMIDEIMRKIAEKEDKKRKHKTYAEERKRKREDAGCEEEAATAYDKAEGGHRETLIDNGVCAFGANRVSVKEEQHAENKKGDNNASDSDWSDVDWGGSTAGDEFDIDNPS